MWFFVAWISIGLVGVLGFGFAQISQLRSEYGKEKGDQLYRDEFHDNTEIIKMATEVQGSRFLMKWFMITLSAIVGWPVALPIMWHTNMKRIRERADENR